MTDTINRADVERLLPLCQRLWPIIQQHPPGSAGRSTITCTLDNMPATDRHICDLQLDRMERSSGSKMPGPPSTRASWTQSPH